MKRLMIILIMAGLYAQERDTIYLSENDMLIKVYEKKFDFPVLDVVFDTATVSLKEARIIGWKVEALSFMENSTKFKVNYPKILLVGKYQGFNRRILGSEKVLMKIKLIDYKMNIIKENEIDNWAKFVYSPNKKFFLIYSIKDEENNKVTVTLYNKEGNIIWQKSRFEPLAVNNEGYTILKAPTLDVEPTKSVIIYNPDGIKIREIKNPYINSSEGYEVAKFSEEGNYGIILFSNFRNSTYVLFSKNGDVMWKKEFKWWGTGIKAVDIAENTGIIGKSGLKNTNFFFIDWAGNLLWRIRLGVPGNYIIRFSEDKKNAYVMSSKGYLWIIDLNKRRISWNYKKSNFDKFFFFDEIYEFKDFIFIIEKIGKKWHSSNLHILDAKRRKLVKILKYPGEKVTFVKNSRYVALLSLSEHKLVIYKLFSK